MLRAGVRAYLAVSRQTTFSRRTRTVPAGVPGTRVAKKPPRKRVNISEAGTGNVRSRLGTRHVPALHQPMTDRLRRFGIGCLLRGVGTPLLLRVIYVHSYASGEGAGKIHNNSPSSSSRAHTTYIGTIRSVNSHERIFSQNNRSFCRRMPASVVECRKPCLRDPFASSRSTVLDQTEEIPYYGAVVTPASHIRAESG